MKTVTKSVDELIKTNESPIPLEVIPNRMGINLCSVDSLTWTRMEDGQLVNLSINFVPSISDKMFQLKSAMQLAIEELGFSKEHLEGFADGTYGQQNQLSPKLSQALLDAGLYTDDKVDTHV